MTIYPVRRLLRPLFWFAGGVLLVLALALALNNFLLDGGAEGRRLPALGMIALALGALIVGLAAYGLHGVQRVPKIRSTVFVGYLIAVLFVCLTLGSLSGILFVNSHDRTLLLILLFFAGGLALTLGYLHARMVSSRLEALIGAADALGLGRYHVRVEIEGSDQFAQLGAVFNNLAARLEAAERKERHLDHLRRDLQGWVGSDLRTPLARTQSTVDALAAGQVDNPDTYLRLLRSAQRNIHLLADLVDDLFDITQLSAGDLAMQRKPTQAESLIAAAVASLADAAQEQGILLSGTAAPGLPTIEVDAHQVSRVLSNLVEHALRRTPAGGVIKLNAYPLRQGVLFEVVDYYEGERPADMAQLLSLFLAEDDVRRRRDSVPLGLAMANTIVEAHGGSIRSERIGGSKGLRLVFTFTQQPVPAAPSEREM